MLLNYSPISRAEDNFTHGGIVRTQNIVPELSTGMQAFRGKFLLAALFKMIESDPTLNGTNSPYAGVDAVIADFDGVDRDHLKGVPDDIIIATRMLSSMGIRKITVTGEMPDLFIKKIEGLKRAASQNVNTQYTVLCRSGAIGNVVTNSGEFVPLEGYPKSSLGDPAAMEKIQRIAREEMFRIGREKGIPAEDLERVKMRGNETGWTLYTREVPSVNEHRFLVVNAIKRRLEALKGTSDILANVDVTASAGAVDIIAITKANAVIQAIKMFNLKKVVIIGDQIGTEEMPGNDRSMLALTKDDLKRAGVYWDVEMVKLYVGRERTYTLPAGAEVSNHGNFETDAALNTYWSVIRANNPLEKILEGLEAARDMGHFKLSFEKAPNGDIAELNVEIPGGTAVRYYNPEYKGPVTPYFDCTEMKTEIISPKLVKQIMTRDKELKPAASQSALNYAQANGRLLADMVGAGKEPVVLRVPVEILGDTAYPGVKAFLFNFLKSPNCYLELFSLRAPDAGTRTLHLLYGLEYKELPEGFINSTLNTITLLPVNKEEVNEDDNIARAEIGGMLKDRLGGMDAKNTIVAPVSFQVDPLDMARGTILGMALLDVARQMDTMRGASLTEDQGFRDKVQISVMEKLKYIYGIDTLKGIAPEDIINLAIGFKWNKNDFMRAFNRIIRLVPIKPIDKDEVRKVYDSINKIIVSI
jgi:hypothetical protein